MFRLFSAVPFVAGVALVTAWLHRRVALSGDPLPLPRDRLAVAARHLSPGARLRARLPRHERRRGRGARGPQNGPALGPSRRCGSPVCLGAWTLPRWAIAVTATAAVLLFDARTRRASAVGLAVVLAATAAWYIPHADAIKNFSDLEDGVQIGFPWVLTAPIDQILLPALLWIDGTALVAGVDLAAVDPGRGDRRRSKPLPARATHRRSPLAAPVATVVVLWIAEARTSSRDT